jgi:hypothetical protein
MATKYTKWPNNRPNGHIIYEHLPLQHPEKFTQTGVFGLKICHLATLFSLSRRFIIRLAERQALENLSI